MKANFWKTTETTSETRAISGKKIKSPDYKQGHSMKRATSTSKTRLISEGKESPALLCITQLLGLWCLGHHSPEPWVDSPSVRLLAWEPGDLRGGVSLCHATQLPIQGALPSHNLRLTCTRHRLVRARPAFHCHIPPPLTGNHSPTYWSHAPWTAGWPWHWRSVPEMCTPPLPRLWGAPTSARSRTWMGRASSSSSSSASTKIAMATRPEVNIPENTAGYPMTLLRTYKRTRNQDNLGSPIHLSAHLWIGGWNMSTRWKSVQTDLSFITEFSG